MTIIPVNGGRWVMQNRYALRSYCIPFGGKYNAHARYLRPIFRFEPTP